MEPQRVRIGELLVAARIITAAQLEEVLERQKGDGRRLGKLLVEAGLVTETQVTQILSQQLSVPWVSLFHIEFSRPLLERLPRQLVEKYGVVPIFVRRVRGLGETLYIAMDDPTDEAAQHEMAQWSGLPVRAMIAPPSDIRAAIHAYYEKGRDGASLSDVMAELEAEQPSRPRASSPGRAPATASASKFGERRELRLTLRDGSLVTLPYGASGARELGALVGALSGDAGILAGASWEAAFTALLALLRDHEVIAEFAVADDSAAD